MNEKQITDLIERMRELGHIYSYQGAKNLIREYEKLNKPEKVKVPQLVEDWIEYCKVRKITLAHALYRSEEAKNKSVFRWLFEDSDNQETFALAWLFGYEIEEEKRYRISMPKARNYMNHAQFLCEKDGKIFWCGEWHPFRTKFTRKEIEEAGFGWVFDCPGVELTEVE
ncbi:DUF1642 domain-containing protein [Streptococcus pneumoniae]|uniref:DUF1642 domain-containing protein n=1 Tax=Streptococcus pseudopneumoniae TaxID=257758 RepID=UPI0031217C7D